MKSFVIFLFSLKSNDCGPISGVQCKQGFVANIFELSFFFFVVVICDLVHDMETTFHPGERGGLMVNASDSGSRGRGF